MISTILHLAMECEVFNDEALAILRSLLKHPKAPFKLVDEDGNTPLHVLFYLSYLIIL